MRISDWSSDVCSSDLFLADGYVIREVADRPALDAMRREIVRLACQHLGCDLPADDGDFLNRIHQRVAVSAVNALRLHVFNGLHAQPWCRPTYLAQGRPVAVGSAAGRDSGCR